MPNTIVVDLGYGDSGKGTVVDALARLNPNTSAVVRYCGGAQAAHNVVTDDGLHHTFSLFGSATFVPNIRTHLSKYVLVNPGNMFREEKHLHDIGVMDAWERTSIHPGALIITPWHQEINKLNMGTRAHGTTGQGIGETMKDSLRQPDEQVLRAGDLMESGLRMRQKIERIAKRKQDEARALGMNIRTLQEIDVTDFVLTCISLTRVVAIEDDLAELAERGDLIFEGAQGVLLDQDYGFHPHTTWSRTTTKNAKFLLGKIGQSAKTVGVIRSYQTRHGNGPFVTEHNLQLDEPHNKNAGWAGTFRTGHLDFVAIKYALMATQPVDSIAITHMDKARDKITVCDSYTYVGGLSDIDPYFHRPDGHTITHIKQPLDLRSHAHTEAVANRLKDMRPNYRTLPSEDFLSAVEETLRRPVELLSGGPTFADKIMLPSNLGFVPSLVSAPLYLS